MYKSAFLNSGKGKKISDLIFHLNIFSIVTLLLSCSILSPKDRCQIMLDILKQILTKYNVCNIFFSNEIEEGGHSLWCLPHRNPMRIHGAHLLLSGHNKLPSNKVCKCNHHPHCPFLVYILRCLS